MVPAPNIRPRGVNIIAELAKAARSRASEPSRGCSYRTSLLRHLLLSRKSRCATRSGRASRFRRTLAKAGCDWSRQRRLEKSSRVLKGRPAAVIVNSGIVHLWGPVGSQEEHKALVALAEGVPGVVSAADEMIPA
jgi:hypothetical protein